MWLLAGYLLQSAASALDLRVLNQPVVDVLLTLALAYALTAPRDAARFAGLFCGLAYDLGASGPIGEHAVALGVAAAVVVALRDALRVNQAVVRFGLAFVGAGVAVLIRATHASLWQNADASLVSIAGGGVVMAAIAALLAAMLAPLVGEAGRPRRFRLRSAG